MFYRSYIFFLLSLGSCGCSIFSSNKCGKFSQAFNVHFPCLVLFKIPVYSQFISCFWSSVSFGQYFNPWKKKKNEVFTSCMMDNNSNYEERKVSKFLYLSSSLCNYDPTAAPTSHNIYVRKYREKEMAGKKKEKVHWFTDFQKREAWDLIVSASPRNDRVSRHSWCGLQVIFGWSVSFRKASSLYLKISRDREFLFWGLLFFFFPFPGGSSLSVKS